MTWNSGSCDDAPHGVTHISTDAYPEPVRITNGQVHADEVERTLVTLDESAGFGHVEHGLHEPPSDVEIDRELFTRVAETHPGIVRTLSVLIGELADVELEPPVLRALGSRIRRVGDTLVMRADRIVVEASSSE